MANYTTTDTELTSVADAIRLKGGTQSPLVYPTGFVTAIGNIPSSGGTDTSDATMTSGDQMLSGVTAYSKGTKYTGTIQSKSAQTYTPTTSSQTIASGQYLSGAQTVQGDANLVSSNIRSGVSIFGVSGSLVIGEPLVHFVDYDGTIIQECTAAEINSMSALPSNPSHTGLTAEGWNWTLAQIKSQLSATNNKGHVWVGQNYITSDGKTHIDISLQYPMTLSLNFGVYGDVNVDFGDGSSVTLSGVSLTTLITRTHTYSSGGQYTIKIAAQSSSDKYSFFSSGSSFYKPVISKENTSSIDGNRGYAATVRAIRLGERAIIGHYAFRYLTHMETITIPAQSVDGGAIGTHAFYYCNSLKCVVIPPSNATLSLSNTFYSCYGLKSVSIPRDVSIESYAFSYAGMKSVTIPYDTGSIGGSAFNGCTNLVDATLPSGVTSLGSSTFSGSNIEEMVIPDSVTSIGQSCFESCVRLRKLSFPSNNTYTNIANYTARYASGLETVIIPYTIKTISNNAFYNCKSIMSLDLRGVTTIKGYAFTGCTFLSHLDIASTTLCDGGNQFSACTNLSELVIPSGYPSISSSMFSSCKSLVRVDVPASVTSIGSGAFNACLDLLEFHIAATSPPTLGDSTVFYQAATGFKIYVPYSAGHSVLSAYQGATNWSSYSSAIVEEPQ